MKKILFINGSPNKEGNTVKIARRLLEGNKYVTLNLVDYKIYPFGQNFDDDQLEEVFHKMIEAGVIVMGSPVYWHSMTGQFRTLLDRIYESSLNKKLQGKDLYFIFQGAAPKQFMLDAGNYTMDIFCQLFNLNYKGMITNSREAEKCSIKLIG